MAQGDGAADLAVRVRFIAASVGQVPVQAIDVALDLRDERGQVRFENREPCELPQQDVEGDDMCLSIVEGSRVDIYRLLDHNDRARWVLTAMPAHEVEDRSGRYRAG